MANLTTITPYIVVSDARAAIELYKNAFGAEAVEVMDDPESGKVMNAQLRIGDAFLMLNDEYPDYGSVGPQPGQNLPVTIHLSVDDIDNRFAQAVAAGLEVTMPLENQFWGDRYGQLKDRFGYNWSMGMPIVDPLAEDAL